MEQEVIVERTVKYSYKMRLPDELSVERWGQMVHNVSHTDIADELSACNIVIESISSRCFPVEES
jgi:hypothetical protein